MMIRLQDEDSGSDDLLDRVIVNQQLSVSSSFTSTRTITGYYGKVTLDLSFRVMCQDNYYGSDCSRYCIPEGHYTCDDQGIRVCLPGYSGSDCLTRKLKGFGLAEVFPPHLKF